VDRKTLVHRLQNLDKRFIYTMVFIVLMVPMFKPIGLPLKVSRETQAAYDTIDSLPAGAVVLFMCGVSPTGEAENEPQTVALLRHLINRKIKVVMAPSVEEAPRYVQRFAELLRKYGYKEGTDFITLPFTAGKEMAYAAMGTDFRSLYQRVPSTPLLESIKDIKSFAAMIECINGENWRWMLAHIEARHKIKCIAMITAINLSACQPYFSSRQLAGVVSGLNGAAEYEMLAKVPGKGLGGMDAQSLGHLWIIALVVLGNVGYAMTKSGKTSQAPGGDH
jgi:hypothetical protein